MGICSLCQFEGKTEWHHISYEKKITKEVCKKCHEEIHHTKKYPELKPIDKRPKSYVDYVDICGNQELQIQNNAQDAKDTTTPLEMKMRKLRKVSEKKYVSINIRISKRKSIWIKENQISPTKLLDVAIKELGYSDD